MGISDFLKGSEKKYKADPLAGDINAVGKQGLDLLKVGGSKLNDIYNQDPNQVIQNQIGMENKLMRGATDDAVRRTRQLITQRGMGNSSIGLGTEVNQQRQLSNQLAANTASGIGRLRDMQIDNGQGLVSTANALYAPKAQQGPVQMQDIKKRSGGYAALVGAGAGAYFGGPQGAQAGYAAGQAYENS